MGALVVVFGAKAIEGPLLRSAPGTEDGVGVVWLTDF